jgi:hypothetical protein
MRSATLRRALLSVVLIATLGACGCPVTKVRQAAARAKRTNTLKVIGLAYLSYVDDNKGKPPTQAADLQKYTGGDPDANAALTDGSFTLIYGVTPKDMAKQGMSATVLGYDKQFDKDNVLVLMGDGSVRIVTAEEFKTMPQAAPEKK